MKVSAMTSLDIKTGASRADQPRPTAIERVQNLLLPRVFLTAVAIGFALAAGAGRLAVKVNIFENFIRFQPIIGSETNFNVTALQLQQLLRAIPREKIAVVVGGSSTFHGYGQGPQDIWTRELQTRLGSRFHVINLALRGGAGDVFGSHAVEMLIRDGYRVLYVCDDRPNVTFHPAGSPALYRYFYYDAVSRGLLADWAPRDAAVRQLERDSPDHIALGELRLRSNANALAYFDDLWTWLSHQYLSLAGWHAFLADWGFAPRRSYPDPQPTMRPGEGYFPSTLDADMRLLRPSTVPLSPEYLAAKTRSANFVPEAVRQRTIMFEARFSPHFVEKFTKDEQASYDRNNGQNIEALQAAGIVALDMGPDWSADDYVDITHFSVQGGRKVAEILALLVVQRARELGYVQ
jgi:hypothetical protein